MKRRDAMHALMYYAEQSPITDPGGASGHLEDLPADVAALRQAALGLVFHYRDEDPASHGVSEDRLPEVDSRYAERMLGRLFELDGTPLSEGRPQEKRLLGCCRDFLVLLVTMARHKGIPARARVGFASYFEEGFNVDHEVAEVWDAAEDRWRLVDPQLGEGFVDETDGVAFDSLDVPRDRFLVGGEAWRTCREGEADPEAFLVDPGLEIEQTRGWSYLRHNLVHDLASLNKAEMVLWDYWGLMETEPPSEKDLALLDRVARATLSLDGSFREVRALYEEEPGLRVPTSVTSYSPTSLPDPLKVTLEI